MGFFRYRQIQLFCPLVARLNIFTLRAEGDDRSAGRNGRRQGGQLDGCVAAQPRRPGPRLEGARRAHPRAQEGKGRRYGQAQSKEERRIGFAFLPLAPVPGQAFPVCFLKQNGLTEILPS